MTAAGTVERRRLPAAVPVAIALAWVAAVGRPRHGIADRFHHDACSPTAASAWPASAATRWCGV